jgi:hypothetical protein
MKAILDRLIPKPREVAPGEGAFSWDRDVALVVEPGNEDDGFAAATLIEACRAWGVRPPRLVAAQSAAEVGAGPVIYAGDPCRLVPLGAIFKNEGIAALEKVGEQGYFLQIRPDRIVVAGNTPVGVYYGVQTLMQLLPVKGAPPTPALEIIDWTVVRQRGFAIDSFAGEVYTPDALKAVVRRAAHYKMNAIVLYMENAFRFPSHPDLAEGRDTLTREEAMEVDAFARRHHLQLQPLFNSPAHMRFTLAHPNYKHLAEGTGMGAERIINVSHPETYPLLADLYGDLCASFSSPFIYMGGDEAFAFGAMASKELTQTIGVENLYLRHVKKIRDVVARHGKRLVVYGDPFEPGFFKNFGMKGYGLEGLSRIPRDVVIAPWHYGKTEEFPFGEQLNALGFEQHLWSSNAAYLTLFPNIEGSAQNVETYTSRAHGLKALGVVHSDWNEPGQNTLSEFNWPAGNVFFAEWAWAEHARPWAEALPVAVESFYGPGAKSLAETLRFLSSMRRYFGWGGGGFVDPGRALFFSPLEPRRLGQFAQSWKDKEGNERVGIPLEEAQRSLDEFRRDWAQAREAFDAAKTAASRNRSHLDYVEFALAQQEAVADLVEARHLMTLPEAQAAPRLKQAVGKLAQTYPALMRRFEELWRRVNKPLGVKGNLERFDAVRKGIDAKREELGA